MTAQLPDVIYHEGRRRKLMATPLEAYFEQGSQRPSLDHSHSALWRGYIGTWRLENEQLFLVHLRSAGAGSRLTLAMIFPEAKRRVFAAWFTGRLRIPEGRCLAALDGGFMSAHKRETLVEVTKGRTTAVRVLHLGTLPPALWPAEVMGNGWG